MQKTTKISRLQSAVLVCCLVLPTLGCQKSEQRVKTYALSGVLTSTGQPLANASIILHPKEASDRFSKPRAVTDDQGKFQFTTYETGDGAPEGEYDVTVEQWYRDDPNKAPINHLPKQLSLPGSSNLKVTVTAADGQSVQLDIPE